MESPVIMKGIKVILTLPIENDLDFLLKVINDPIVTKYLRFPNVLHFPNDEREWLLNLSREQSKNKVFLIRSNDDSTPLGVVGLHSIDTYNGHAELGYMIQQSSWGKGIATESVKLALEYGFEILNLRKIYAYVKDGNIGSVRVLEKNGFKRVGYFSKHDYVPYEGYRDLLIFEKFKDDEEGVESKK